MSPLAGLILAVPLAFVANWAIYRWLLTPLVNRAKSRGQLEVDSILATFGLLFIVQGIALIIFGGQYYSYSYLSVPVSVLGVPLALNRLLALALAVLIAVGLYLALTRTRTGTAIRAVAVDPNAARLVAIDVATASAFAFALGGALVAAGGVLVSMFLTFNAAMGVVFTMKALIVVIVGGLGNIMGALAVGLLLGLIETAVSRLLDPGLTLAATYALFMIALLVRPTGLFGRPRAVTLKATPVVALAALGCGGARRPAAVCQRIRPGARHQHAQLHDARHGVGAVFADRPITSRSPARPSSAWARTRPPCSPSRCPGRSFSSSRCSAASAWRSWSGFRR